MSPVPVVATPRWPAEFAKIVTCSRCTMLDCRELLRDEVEHVPQPGYIGDATRLLLVGQNPGVDTVGLATRDCVYTAALREVGRNPTTSTYAVLSTAMDEFVPSWPFARKVLPPR
jgi:hypothetical protein